MHFKRSFCYRKRNPPFEKTFTWLRHFYQEIIPDDPDPVVWLMEEMRETTTTFCFSSALSTLSSLPPWPCLPYPLPPSHSLLWFPRISIASFNQPRPSFTHSMYRGGKWTNSLSRSKWAIIYFVSLGLTVSRGRLLRRWPDKEKTRMRTLDDPDVNLSTFLCVFVLV